MVGDRRTIVRVLWASAFRRFRRRSIQFQSNFERLAPLAGDLALSVCGLLCGWARVPGFRLNHKLIRSIGLRWRHSAGLKIVLYDLAKSRGAV